MEQAIHEIVSFGDGLELPIQCNCSHMVGVVDALKRPPHYHEHIEFLYAHKECNVTVWVAGEEVRLGKGDLIIVNSNVAHTFLNHGGTSEYTCIKALPEMIYSADNSFFDIKYIMPFFGNSLVSFQRFSAAETENTEIPSAFCDALAEWRRRSYGYEVSLKSLLLKIFLWVIRYSYAHGLYPAAPEGDSSSENTLLIHRSVEYINVNFADVTETEAASAVGMSCSHYSRQFKRVMGKSFREYVSATRINAAERLLLTTDTSVTEIALACGFATSSHFIESFKSKKHLTPRQYRKTWVTKQSER